MGSREVCILTGADYYNDVVHSGYKRVCGVVLVPTKFGYSLLSTLVDMVFVLRINEIAGDQLVDGETHNDPKVDNKVDLERLWKLDHPGINPKEADEGSKFALQQFEESVS